MKKERFISKYDLTATIISDLNAVIAYEIDWALAIAAKDKPEINPIKEPKKVCEKCKVEISKWGCGCGKKDNPAPNPIREAYEIGLRIREKKWAKNFWIKKQSETNAIDEIGQLWGNNWGFDRNSEKWELYTEAEAEQPAPNPIAEMTENEKIEHILKNKLTWKPFGKKKFYANWFSEENNQGYRRVHFVDNDELYGGYVETRIFTIDLSEWQPVVTDQPAPAKPKFDQDRFEAMFRAVVASGLNARYEDDVEYTKEALTKLDAYYATQKGGNNG